MDYLLQFRQISDVAVNSVKDSFNNLPETSHKDGKYRLRRYSVVQPLIGNIHKLPQRSFTQSSDYNKFQGGMSRDFEELEDSVVSSVCMSEMCYLFKEVNRVYSTRYFEIHQMRIVVQPHAPNAEVSPEGVHRDGFDAIAMLGINRENVKCDSGQVSIYRNCIGIPNGGAGEQLMETTLFPGEIVFIDDKNCWHWGSPIEVIDKDKPGYVDMFILTANLQER